MNVPRRRHHSMYQRTDGVRECMMCCLEQDFLTTDCLGRTALPSERDSIDEGWDFLNFAWVYDPARRSQTQAEPITQPIPTCLTCERELSTYLDAYYGTDPVARSLCAGCRDRRARLEAA